MILQASMHKITQKTNWYKVLQLCEQGWWLTWQQLDSLRRVQPQRLAFKLWPSLTQTFCRVVNSDPFPGADFNSSHVKAFYSRELSVTSSFVSRHPTIHQRLCICIFMLWHWGLFSLFRYHFQLLWMLLSLFAKKNKKSPKHLAHL